MRGGVLRIGLLVAAVGLGILLIAEGFGQAVSPTIAQPTDGNGNGNGDGGDGSPSPDQSPTIEPTDDGNGNGGNGNPPANCRRQGVRVAAYNASQTDGLAGLTRERLEREGYLFEGEDSIGDAPQISPRTIVYYRDAADKGEAECLGDVLFPGEGAQVKKLPSEATYFPENAQLAVLLGADYAAENPPV